ncbi:Acyl-CoA-binding domain-containing protein 5 [Lunasporangiospora selenospora]|uniref:Acyl-CoA-binding domain-containing protein 5 n=1 Tax=Lunasporangiospora selenospora TaxID=979761 RepID=A0A9P6KH97_9FUNG|nr:Acyl-CoA-binding domain-containing protein 5 [Lunasporangiospora selenospora]
MPHCATLALPGLISLLLVLVSASSHSPFSDDSNQAMAVHSSSSALLTTTTTATFTISLAESSVSHDSTTSSHPTPSPMVYPASGYGAGTWFIQGGYDGSIASTDGYSLNLAVPWNASTPPWVRLPPGPEIATTTLIVSVNNTFVFRQLALQTNYTNTSMWPAQGTVLAPISSETNALPYLSLLDLSTQTWIRNASRLHVPRRTSGLLPVGNPLDGKIYIRGGYTSEKIDTLDVFDPEFDTMISLPLPMAAEEGGMRIPPLTQWYSAVWSSRRRSILYFGGRYKQDYNYTTGLLFEYLPDSNTWQILETSGKAPSPREDACMATDESNSRVVLFGGQDTDGTKLDIFILNVDTLHWAQGASPRDGRVGFVCALYEDGFLVWGGAKDILLTSFHTSRPAVYNLTTNQWTPTYRMAYDPKSLAVDDYGPKSGNSNSTLGLVLGLSMTAVAVGALCIGILLYRRERRKATQNFDRFKGTIGMQGLGSGAQSGAGVATSANSNRVKDSPDINVHGSGRYADSDHDDRSVSTASRSKGKGKEKEKVHVGDLGPRRYSMTTIPVATYLPGRALRGQRSTQQDGNAHASRSSRNMNARYAGHHPSDGSSEDTDESYDDESDSIKSVYSGKNRDEPTSAPTRTMATGSTASSTTTASEPSKSGG